MDVDLLVDSHVVADILGLAQFNSVSGYQRRYPDMPRPVIDMGNGRCKLWLRPEIETWAKRTGRLGRPRERDTAAPQQRGG